MSIDEDDIIMIGLEKIDCNWAVYPSWDQEIEGTSGGAYLNSHRGATSGVFLLQR